MDITRRGFLNQAMTAVGAAAAWPLLVKETEIMQPRSSRKPNILVIVADDMGFSDAGCYGGDIETPNLDALAENGVRFTQGYSTGRCWPSRACILTGYYAQQIRMDPPKGRFPKWAHVAPHYLKPLGDRCYHSGKWHLVGAPKGIADGGFDRSYMLHDHNRYFSPQKHELDDQPLPAVDRGAGKYVTTMIADYAKGFLQEHAQNRGDDPFFLYLAFTSPHFPLHALQDDIARYRDRFNEGWDVVRGRRWKRLRDMGIVNCDLSPLDPETIPDWNLPEEELKKAIGPGEAGNAVSWDSLTDEQKEFQATKMAIHAAMIDRMDREIGRVLDQIKVMGAFDNTVIMFVSDNGASAEQIIRGDNHDPAAPPGSAASYLCLGPGWSTASNTPFRLHKSWVHEGGIASPLIVHWRDGISTRGELRHTPCHFIDILPTLVELAGGDIHQSKDDGAPALPGRSLVKALAEDVDIPRDYLYFHHIGNRALRVGDWKLVAKGADGPWELYDLSTDRCEMRNLASRHPDRVNDLACLWEEAERTYRAQAGPLDDS